MLVTLNRLLNHLNLIPRRGRLSAARRDRRQFLSLETLEDRLCPSTDIWIGGGGNANWSNPLNWQAHVAPQAGDILEFATAPASAKVSVNDYAAGTIVFNSLQFQAGGYQINGNAVQLSNGIQNASGFNTINAAITLTADQTFADNSGSTLDLTGYLNNGGRLLTVNSNGNVIYSGPQISGSGGLTMTGNAKFFLEDATPDTYTGVTTIISGTMYLDGAQGNAIVGDLVLGDGVGSNELAVVREAASNQIADGSAVSITWTGLLDLNGFEDTIGPLTMTGGNITTGTGTLTLTDGLTTLASSHTAVIAGNLSLGSGATPQTFTVASGSTTGNDLNVTAVVSGGPGVELIKAGTGAMQLTGDDVGNTYLGSTLVSAGTLVAANAEALGATSAGTTVDAGATLDYQDPNADPGYTFAAEPLTLDGGTLLVNGNAPVVTAPGPLTLAADSTIEVNVGTTLDLTGPVSGPGGLTKAWAGELDLAHANSYTGATVVSNGVLALDNPQALGAGAVKVGAQGELELQNGRTYTNALSLSGTLFCDGSATWAGPISLTGAADMIVLNGGVLTVSGPISGPAANSLTVGAAQDAGTVLLTSANTYAGTTEVAYGVLAISNADALGSPGGNTANGGTTVDAGATLQLQGGLAVDPTESLTLNGTGVNGQGALLDASGNDSWNGPITLAGTSAIGAAPGTTLTINGVISGPSTSNLLIMGGGTVVLAGTNTNYDGYTRVLAGVLALDNAQALGGAPYNGGAGTTVEAGATLQLWALPPGVPYVIEPLILNGTGLGGEGALENLTGNNTWQGPIRLDSDATITCAAGSTFTDGVQVMNEGYTLTVNAVGNVDLATVVSGAGGLVKDGAGTLTFSSGAPNLYAGPTVVNGGTLMLTKPAAVASVGGAGLTINAGGTVAGSGTIDCNVTVNAGGALDDTGTINGNVTNAGMVNPGGPGVTGTLTVNGNYTQTTGGELDIELESTTAIDRLMISGAADLAGTLKVSLLDGFQPKSGERFTFLTFGSRSGQFTTTDLPADLSLVYDPRDAALVAH